MSNFTIVQLHKPDEKHLIKVLPYNHIILETVKSDKYEVKITVDRIVDGNRLIIGKLFYDEWRFDLARNTAKELVKTDYTFMLDADEEIIYGDISKAIESKKECYAVNLINLLDNEYSQTFKVPRLFKTNINYFGWCHEMPETNDRQFADIIIRHTGYSNDIINRQKAKRNADLILKSGLAMTNKYQREKLKQSLSLEE